MTLPRYQPMLASQGDETGPGWAYELKWDGVRAIAYWDGERTELVSRRGNVVTATYPELARFSADRPCIVDGEVVALDDGLPSFERLQARMNLRNPADARTMAAAVPVSFVAFDLLYRDEPLLDEPLERRRELLAGIDLPAPYIASELYPDRDALWSFVADRGLEGIVAKRLASRYVPGARSPDWRKMPHYRTLLAVVGGFTPGERGRAATFGSLAVGLRTAEGLRWVGTVGSGFTDRQLVDIRGALDEMRVADCPFLPDPDLPAGWSWVEPQLVAVVQYKELTRMGRLRAPVFVGFSGASVAAASWDQVG